MWQEKQIPTYDKFVYAYKNTEFNATEWLSGLIYYFFSLSPLGDKGLYVLRTLMAILILVVLKKTFDIFTPNKLLSVSFTSAFAYLLAFRMVTDRPEIFSYLFLAIVNYVGLLFYKTGKLSKLSYLLPIIFLAWPNMHAMTVVGVALIVFFLFITLLNNHLYTVIARSRRRRGNLNSTIILGTSKARTPESKNLKIFAAISILSIAASLIVAKRFFYFINVAQAQPFDIKELASIPSRLSEIKYGFLTQVPPEISIFFLTFVTFVAFGTVYATHAFRKKNYSETIMTLFYFGILAVSFKFYRLITTSLLLSSPIILFLIDTSIKNKKAKNYAAAIILVVSIILMVFSIFHGYIIGARNTWQYVTNLKNQEIVGVRNHSWIDDYPYKTNQIMKTLNTKRLFTSNPWRSYYVWYFPQIKIPSDIIFEYQTKKGFDDEEKIRFGKENWKELFQKSGADTVVNSPFESSFTNATPVYELPDWKLVYVDEVSSIYAKTEIIKNLALDLSKIQPELNTQLKFKPENEKEAVIQLQKLRAYDTKNLFARQQLILDLLNNKKDFKKAETLAWESYNIAPNYPYFALYLTIAHAALGQCEQANTWAGITKAKSFNDVIFEDQTKNALLPCQTGQ